MLNLDQLVAPNNGDQLRANRMKARRSERDEFADFLMTMSTLDRVRACGARIIDGEGVKVRVKDGVAHFTGLSTCASVHACPRCSAKIRNRRAEEVDQLLSRHLDTGGGAFFITFTIRHHAGQRLSPLYDVVRDAWHQLVAYRAGLALQDRYGVVGIVRSLETNHGRNGWHPHLHTLWLLDRVPRAADRELLARELHDLWNAALVGLGLGTIERGIGVDVRSAGRGSLAAYMVGMEMARSDLKEGRSGGRSPVGLLRDAMHDGDVDALTLWWEYEKASKGRRAITWSRGLKARYGIGVQTDEEIANEEVGGLDVAGIGGEVWGAVCRTRGMRARIKRAAEDAGADGVNELLDRVEHDLWNDRPYGSDVGDLQMRENRRQELGLAIARVGRRRKRPVDRV